MRALTPRRRTAAMAATVPLTLALAGTALGLASTPGQAAPTTPTSAYRATATGAVTPRPKPVLSKGNLPAESDLQFLRRGDWRLTRSTATVGLDPVSDCWTGRNFESLQPQTSYRRDYRLRGSGADDRAGAYSFEFGSRTTATTAYDTLSRWISQCPATLRRLGYERAGVDPWANVKAGDRARYTVVAHPQLDHPGSPVGVFEEAGLVQTGRRVTVVVMVTEGEDYNFSAVPSPDLSTYPMIRSLPAVGRRLAADATLPRHLATAQLLTVGDVSRITAERVVAVPAGKGRVLDEAAVCQRAIGLTELWADQVHGRSFGYGSTPSVFSVALQYPSAAAARAAQRTYRERIAACPKQLRAEGYWVGSPLGWIKGHPAHGAGQFTEIVYRMPGHTGSESGFFESIGLTRVGDRLMITVTVVYGMDYNVSLDPGGDPSTGTPAHPQFALIKAAARRLAG